VEKRFQSIEEYYAFVDSLATRMEGDGRTEAAMEVRKGLLALNGLTDGWGALMESLERTIAQEGQKLASDQSADLQRAFQVARAAVYRQ
jgi:hypothetical protein